ncbi:unnamed protein product [Ixodes hexagonus]
MTDAGFFRGTSAEQDNRFTDKQKKLLKQLKFHDVLTKRVDMNKVNLDTIKPWITRKITDFLGMEDEVVVEFVFNQLEAEKHPDPRMMQINLTGFLNGKNARDFMGDLWTLLLSAQESVGGIPAEFLEQKKEEIKKRQEEQERMQENVRRMEEKEREKIAERVRELAPLLRERSPDRAKERNHSEHKPREKPADKENEPLPKPPPPQPEDGDGESGNKETAVEPKSKDKVQSPPAEARKEGDKRGRGESPRRRGSPPRKDRRRGRSRSPQRRSRSPRRRSRSPRRRGSPPMRRHSPPPHRRSPAARRASPPHPPHKRPGHRSASPVASRSSSNSSASSSSSEGSVKKAKPGKRQAASPLKEKLGQRKDSVQQKRHYRSHGLHEESGSESDEQPSGRRPGEKGRGGMRRGAGRRRGSASSSGSAGSMSPGRRRVRQSPHGSRRRSSRRELAQREGGAVVAQQLRARLPGASVRKARATSGNARSSNPVRPVYLRHSPARTGWGRGGGGSPDPRREMDPRMQRPVLPPNMMPPSPPSRGQARRSHTPAEAHEAALARHHAMAMARQQNSHPRRELSPSLDPRYDGRRAASRKQAPPVPSGSSSSSSSEEDGPPPEKLRKKPPPPESESSSSSSSGSPSPERLPSDKLAAAAKRPASKPAAGVVEKSESESESEYEEVEVTSKTAVEKSSKKAKKKRRKESESSDSEDESSKKKRKKQHKKHKKHRKHRKHKKAKKGDENDDEEEEEDDEVALAAERSEEEPVPEELERKLREKALRSLNKARNSTDEAIPALFVN